jgi:hypothetical protein
MKAPVVSGLGLLLALAPSIHAQSATFTLSVPVVDVTSFSVSGTTELDLRCTGSFSVGTSGTIRDGETQGLTVAQGGVRVEAQVAIMGVRDSAGSTLRFPGAEWNLNGWAPDLGSSTGEAVQFEGGGEALSGDTLVELSAGCSVNCGGATWSNGAGRFSLSNGGGAQAGRNSGLPVRVDIETTAEATLSYEAIRWRGGAGGLWSGAANWNSSILPIATQPGGEGGYPVVNETADLIVVDRDLRHLDWYDRGGGTLYVHTARRFAGETLLHGAGLLLLDGSGAALELDSLELLDGFNVQVNNGAFLAMVPGSAIRGAGGLTLIGPGPSTPTWLRVDQIGEGIEVSAGEAQIEPAARFGPLRNAGRIVQSGARNTLRIWSRVVNTGELSQEGEEGLLQVDGLVNSGRVQVGFGVLRCSGLNNSGIVRIDPEGTLRTTGYDQTAGTTQLDGTLRLDTSGGDRVVRLAGGTLCGSGRIASTGPGRVIMDVAAGAICPGASPGEIVLNGDLRCGPDCLLDFEMAGPDPKSADRLRVLGPVELGGTLRISFLDGYRPKPGTVWDVITSTGGFSGTLPRVEFADKAVRYSLETVDKGGKKAATLRLKFLGRTK